LSLVVLTMNRFLVVMDLAKKPARVHVQEIVLVLHLVPHVLMHVQIPVARIVVQTAQVGAKGDVPMHVAVVRGLADKHAEAHAPITAIQVVEILVAMLVQRLVS